LRMSRRKDHRNFISWGCFPCVQCWFSALHTNDASCAGDDDTQPDTWSFHVAIEGVHPRSLSPGSQVSFWARRIMTNTARYEVVYSRHFYGKLQNYAKQ
jgi:hypothetical protein